MSEPANSRQHDPRLALAAMRPLGYAPLDQHGRRRCDVAPHRSLLERRL